MRVNRSVLRPLNGEVAASRIPERLCLGMVERYRSGLDHIVLASITMTNGASREIKVEQCDPNNAVSLLELPHHINLCEGVHSLRIAPATMVMP